MTFRKGYFVGFAFSVVVACFAFPIPSNHSVPAEPPNDADGCDPSDPDGLCCIGVVEGGYAEIIRGATGTKGQSKKIRVGPGSLWKNPKAGVQICRGDALRIESGTRVGVYAYRTKLGVINVNPDYGSKPKLLYLDSRAFKDAQLLAVPEGSVAFTGVAAAKIRSLCRVGGRAKSMDLQPLLVPQNDVTIESTAAGIIYREIEGRPLKSITILKIDPRRPDKPPVTILERGDSDIGPGVYWLKLPYNAETSGPARFRAILTRSDLEGRSTMNVHPPRTSMISQIEAVYRSKSSLGYDELHNALIETLKDSNSATFLLVIAELMKQRKLDMLQLSTTHPNEYAFLVDRVLEAGISESEWMRLQFLEP